MGVKIKKAKEKRQEPRGNVGFANVDESLSSGKLGKMLNAQNLNKNKNKKTHPLDTVGSSKGAVGRTLRNLDCLIRLEWESLRPECRPNKALMPQSYS